MQNENLTPMASTRRLSGRRETGGGATRYGPWPPPLSFIVGLKKFLDHAITFDPQSGHEQKGRHPALVVSKDLFNCSTGLIIVCPVTNKAHGFPFHVPIPKGSQLTGFIMVEQVKTVDFRSRHAKRIEHGSEGLLSEVLSILDACIY